MSQEAAEKQAQVLLIAGRGLQAPPAGDLRSLSLRLYLPFKPNHSFLKISNANEPEHQDIK